MYPLTNVRHFLHTDPGAPQLTSVAGSLFAILDACLIDGFTAFSLLSLSIASNVATATTSTAHGLRDAAVVEIAGSSITEANGVFRVEVVDTTTFTFPVEADDGTASGTITAKMAAQGEWEIAEDGTATAERIYKSTDVLAYDRSLYVQDTDDTGLWSAARYGSGYWAQWSGKTGEALASGTLFSSTSCILKARATSTDYPWFLVCDSRFIYFVVGTINSLDKKGSICSFGDLAGAIYDYAAISNAMRQESTTLSNYARNGAHFIEASGACQYIQDTPETLRNCSMVFHSGAVSYSGYTSSLGYPLADTTDAILIEESVWMLPDTTRNRWLGVVPGFKALFHPVTSLPINAMGVMDYPQLNKLLMLAKNQTNNQWSTYTDYVGGGFIDVIGPWR